MSALQQLGGSARPAEVRTQVAKNLSISEAQQDDLLESGTPRFDNQIAWARFYLARASYIDASKRGVWSLTEKSQGGMTFTQAQALILFQRVHAEFESEARDNGEAEEVSSPLETPDQPASYDYQQDLLDTLQALAPEGFERFCQRLLREAGFQEVTVTGRSGDGGIDGIGILQVNQLVSFKVLFQRKRYKGVVIPSQVRDFRGAMSGRADKGIILTTGSFTTEAKREATRDGVHPIELVDGEKLVNMLELGLKPVTIYPVDQVFFDGYR